MEYLLENCGMASENRCSLPTASARRNPETIGSAHRHIFNILSDPDDVPEENFSLDEAVRPLHSPTAWLNDQTILRTYTPFPFVACNYSSAPAVLELNSRKNSKERKKPPIGLPS